MPIPHILIYKIFINIHFIFLDFFYSCSKKYIKKNYKDILTLL